MLMKFLTFCLDYEQHPDEFQGSVSLNSVTSLSSEFAQLRMILVVLLYFHFVYFYGFIFKVYSDLLQC